MQYLALIFAEKLLLQAHGQEGAQSAFPPHPTGPKGPHFGTQRLKFRAQSVIVKDTSKWLTLNSDN